MIKTKEQLEYEKRMSYRQFFAKILSVIIISGFLIISYGWIVGAFLF